MIAFAILATTAHLLAMGLWFGGLFALAVGSLPILAARKSQAPAGTSGNAYGMRLLWARYSLLAVTGAGLIVITGLYNTARQVASIDALLITLSGRALLLKIGLMIVAGALGLINATMIHPALAALVGRIMRRPKEWSPMSVERLHRIIVIELCVAGTILAAASLLTAAAPARGPEFAPRQVNMSPSMVADDVLVTLSIKPNLPGENVISTAIASTRRPEPAPILRVIQRLTYQDGNLGPVSADAIMIDKGRYQLGTKQLSMAGRWAIDVVVRRKGLEDAVAHFDWVVPATATHTVIVSDQALEADLLVYATIALIPFSLIMMFLWLRRRNQRSQVSDAGQMESSDSSS
jgi:copper transport protein